jgi:alpha-tubulin suppressor-like RCC1 family protein
LPGRKLLAFLWGSGKDGRCGSGTEDKIATPAPLFADPNAALSIQKLACGYHHSAAVTDKGSLYTWGRGIFGQLGHGSNESYMVPVKVNMLSSYIVTDVACGW